MDSATGSRGACDPRGAGWAPGIAPGFFRGLQADREVQLTFGQCVVFDDSFLHSAWNMSDQPRFVLLFDFFHPDLTPAEIEHLLGVSAAGKTQSGYMQQMEPARSPDWVYA